MFLRRLNTIVVTSIMILGAAGSEPLARASRVAQAGGIKGQVVADITDKRRPLAGVIVNLSGERLADNSSLRLCTLCAFA